MLYSEFLEGTKARANESNYEVYKAFEGVYVTIGTITKAEVYKMAKPWVNRVVTEDEQKYNKKIQENIEYDNDMIEVYQSNIDYYTRQLCYSNNAKEVRHYRNLISQNTKQIAEMKKAIKELEKAIIK